MSPPQDFLDDAILDRHASEEEMRAAVERVWREFWEPIISNAHIGVSEAADLSDSELEQIKAELYDYHGLMSNVSKVYCEITNGRVSKPNTTAQAVLGEAEEARREDVGRGIVDELESHLDDVGAGTYEFLVETIADVKKEYGLD